MAPTRPESVAQDRLHRWLRARRAIADKSLDELAETIRPVALPIGHDLHPGPRWVRQPVLGGSLDLGIGFVGLLAGQPELVFVTPPSVLAAAGIDPSPWWPGAIGVPREHGRIGNDALASRPPGPTAADGRL